ncbi:MAG: hypothetical protein AABY88_04945 [Pseudomonadota bacterium]
MNEELAKKRFMILNLVRFSALAFIFAGAANIGGKLLPELMPTLGYVLLVIGAVDFFLAPVLLKRLWRTPE